MVAGPTARRSSLTDRPRPRDVLEPLPAASCGRRARKLRQHADVVESWPTCDATPVLVLCTPRGPAATRLRDLLRARPGPARDARPDDPRSARGPIPRELRRAPAGRPARARRAQVGEEAVEVCSPPPASVLSGEVADLWFHSMVLLARGRGSIPWRRCSARRAPSRRRRLTGLRAGVQLIDQAAGRSATRARRRTPPRCARRLHPVGRCR